MQTILIVDDRPVNRQFLLTILEDRGYRLLEAGDGAHALALAQTVLPDLVITDIVMPTLDGYALARRIAEDPRLAKTQVILFSAAYHSHEARALIRECRIAAFLRKPCEPEQILDAVQGALGAASTQPTAAPDPSVSVLHAQVVSGKLYQKIAELEQLQTQLEERVEQRTLELRIEIDRRVDAERALQEANRRLSDEALRDSLTGLYNRRYIELALRREIARARRHNRPLSVLLIDVDHFKHCNDSLGHAAGDSMLRAVSERLRDAVREEDTVCRYGGDEFLVLMPGAQPQAAQDCAKRLGAILRKLQVVDDGRPLPPVTLSIGVAALTESNAEGLMLLQAADRALYRAKRNGRDHSELFSDFVNLSPAKLPAAEARSAP